MLATPVYFLYALAYGPADVHHGKVAHTSAEAVDSMETHVLNKYSSCADFNAAQHDSQLGQQIKRHLRQQLSLGRFLNGLVVSIGFTPT
jgi:hypothetical protein